MAAADAAGAPATVAVVAADVDGDGIDDAKDACPREKGARTDDPKTNGCPSIARVEGTQIVITEQVVFGNGNDTLDPASFPVLTGVATLLAAHPEIARLAVDGHTDDRGVAARNMALSQRRAVAVVRWLVEHGVDARRLETRAFGPRRPIADNKTEAGRAKNRRVEFQIKKRTADGAAGWTDGPVE
jgi:outer membrane protein OmpA-like peptidoglycan-associated protein